MTVLTNYSKDYETFIGIDVDKNSFSFTVINNDIMNHTKKIPSDPKQLYNYINKNFNSNKTLCVYEAGPTGYHLYDHLVSVGCNCIVVSPNTIPKASNEKVKNNNIDSQKLAKHLRAGQLRSIRVPTGSYRELRELVRISENYTTSRKVAKQRIKSLLLHANLYQHIKESDKNWSSRYIQELKKIPSSYAVRNRLDMLLTDLDYARNQLLLSHRHLKIFIKNEPAIYKNMHYLQSIPGIGFITSVTLLGKIGDPGNLKNIRELAGFIGLTPTENSTGDSVNRGPISHLGDHRLRSLLIEAAWISIRHDTELRQFYHRVSSRNHPKARAQKAIVAVARKLTQRVYRVLKEQRIYIVH